MGLRGLRGSAGRRRPPGASSPPRAGWTGRAGSAVLGDLRAAHLVVGRCSARRWHWPKKFPLRHGRVAAGGHHAAHRLDRRARKLACSPDADSGDPVRLPLPVRHRRASPAHAMGGPLPRIHGAGRFRLGRGSSGRALRAQLAARRRHLSRHARARIPRTFRTRRSRAVPRIRRAVLFRVSGRMPRHPMLL